MNLSTFPQENFIDFKVKFDVSTIFLETQTFSSTLEGEHMLCNNYWANQRKMDISKNDLQEYSGVNHFMVGILLNGVPLLSSLSYLAFYDALQSSTSSLANAI